jgi:hypothetical protein
VVTLIAVTLALACLAGMAVLWRIITAPDDVWLSAEERHYLDGRRAWLAADRMWHAQQDAAQRRPPAAGDHGPASSDSLIPEC